MIYLPLKEPRRAHPATRFTHFAIASVLCLLMILFLMLVTADITLQLAAQLPGGGQ